MSPAGARVFQILQNQEGLSAHLDRLHALWRAETVIHGDVKSDNVLVRASRGSDAALTEVWLVDWEFVQIGDPAWDLAGSLHDFLVFWTASMPLDTSLSPEERIAQAPYPLGALRPAIRAFWEAYQSSAAITPEAADELLLRAVAFSGARLIQAAHEMSAEQVDLSTLTVILLQISANLLANPVLAQVHLYGIPCRSIPT
jgi:aminoglycoside phosphotransferase (APT) family kinase protein